MKPNRFDQADFARVFLALVAVIAVVAKVVELLR
jgi:hypothetical protein